MNVRFQIDPGGIGRITLSNPPHNALVRPDFVDLDQLQRFVGRSELRGLLLTGAGRHFCAGADRHRLTRARQDPDALAEAANRGRRAVGILARAPLPLVAAVRGSCLGGGLEIALACHFRVASRNALFGFPEADLGLMPGLGGVALAEELLGRAATAELVLDAPTVGADRALSLGLVDRVVATAEVVPQAIRLLRGLVGDRSPRLVRAVMTAINNAADLPLAEALAAESSLFLRVILGPAPGENGGENKLQLFENAKETGGVDR